jgi:hypothetical protein
VEKGRVGCVSRSMIIGVYLRLSAVKYLPPINADTRNAKIFSTLNGRG